MSDSETVVANSQVKSTLAGLFELGFSQIGDSRDFTNDSLQVLLARGPERLTWTFPMKKAVVGLATKEGSSYLQIAPQDISFDVVVPSK